MTPVQLFNTLSRRKEVFEPLEPGSVRMYVCGPTVYDLAHIGNARPVVVFDVLFRLLRDRYGGGQVTYVRNITDVDDKIIEAARRNDEPIERVTARTATAYAEDMAALGALQPTCEPRATGHIDAMIAMISRLIESGHAYAAEGHVLFDVTSMADYGRLSGRSREDLIAGARVEVAPYKRDPADFVLWKPAGADEPGWDSPWGRGRPGWHIECSAMSATHLGPVFDIHGGGLDLVFPHHENEIAQSRCAHGTPLMARYWLHNGYVMVEGQKMSKSLGNFITVRDLLEEHPGLGEAIRLTLLSAHYRQPLDFTLDKLHEATATLDRLYAALRDAARVRPAENVEPSGVLEALADDLNTPRAIAELHEAAGRLNRAESSSACATAKAELLAGGGLLGLLGQDPEAWLQRGATDGPSAEEIETAIGRRREARKAKDFAAADRIRDELSARGVILEDKPGGLTVWRRAG